MTRVELCLACGLVPCTCEARKAAARERAKAARSLACLCALCHHRWIAAELTDCPNPSCGGTRRVRGGRP